MARLLGRPGKTLLRQLVRESLFALFLSAGLVLLVPWGWILSVLLLVAHFRSPRFRYALKGWMGEVRVGRALRRLPRGFYVLCDVDLGGENADFVVVGPGGVYSVEVKNYSLPVEARSGSLYLAGRPKGDLVLQALRQAGKLSAQLGVRVQPVLVFLGRLKGAEAGGVVLLSLEELPGFLSRKRRGLPGREAQRILQLLRPRLR